MSKCLCASMRGLSLNTRNEFFGNAVSFHDAAPRKMSSSMTIEAAHKKGAGSTKNGRDSISKRRGVKVFGMQKVKAGGIIMRQLGTKFHPGENVGLGRDYTIFAKQDGIVFFERGEGTRKLISVYSEEHPKIQAKRPPPEPRDTPTRRERWRAMHTPRAVLREQARQRRFASSNGSTPEAV